MVAGLALFVGSIASTKLLPSGFIPPEDIARTLLAVELPPGSRLADTDAVTRRNSQKVTSLPEFARCWCSAARSSAVRLKCARPRS